METLLRVETFTFDVTLHACDDSIKSAKTIILRVCNIRMTSVNTWTQFCDSSICPPCPPLLTGALLFPMGDRAPALTTLNKIWWALEDQRRPQLQQLLECYWNGPDSFTKTRSLYHNAFHQECPAGSDAWGTHAASMSMATLTPKFFKANTFNQKIRHEIMEAYFWWLKTQGYDELWSYAIETTNLLSDLQCSPWYLEAGSPTICTLGDLLQLRATFVRYLRALR